jgi:hypothetical protein
MKHIVLGIILIVLISCSKTIPNVITPGTQVVISPVEIPKIIYYGKTSYELKNTKKWLLKFYKVAIFVTPPCTTSFKLTFSFVPKGKSKSTLLPNLMNPNS